MAAGGRLTSEAELAMLVPGPTVSLSQHGGASAAQRAAIKFSSLGAWI